MNAIAHPIRLTRTTRNRAALDASERIDIVGISRGIWRRKWLILVLTMVLTAIAAVVILSLTPRYYAESQVIVDDRRVHDVALQDVVPGHIVTDDVVLSEAQIIASRDLAKGVIDKLGLASDPEFNPALRPSSLFDRYEGKVRALLAEVMQWEPGATAQKKDQHARVVDVFLSKLSVALLGRSRVIRVGFDSESPRTAALVVNTMADLYLDHQLRAKADAAKHATAWIEANLTDLQRKAESARAAKEQFRSEAGLLQPSKDVTLTMQQASVVNQQLAEARTRVNDAEARLGYVKAAIASGGGADSLSEIVGSRQIQVLRQQEALLRQKVADLEANFGPKHPRVLQAVAELQNVRGSIRQETDRILQSLNSDVTREKSVVARLTTMLDGVKDKLGRENMAWQKLAVLDQQLSADDSIYTNFLDRVKQTSLQQTNQHPDAEIVSRADTPQQPFFPRRRPLLALALITSCLLSTSAALALDQRRKGFVAVDQVQLTLGNRSLGLLPMVKAARDSSVNLPLEMRSGQAAGFAEAIRSLHVRLVMSEPNRPKVIMFASALPAEGKTTASLALAALIAQTGRRALIIDSDSRQPNIHRAFGLARSPGLTDYLQGAPLETVLAKEVAPNIDVIPAGNAVPHPANLLGSAQMRSLISEVSKHYELVIIDSPPVMAVSDALVLGPLVDKTIFVVRWNTTPQPAAERGLRQFSEVGADVAGTVLSMVNMEKLASHDPSISYHGQIRRYYATQ